MLNKYVKFTPDELRMLCSKNNGAFSKPKNVPSGIELSQIHWYNNCAYEYDTAHRNWKKGKKIYIVKKNVTILD